MPSEVDQSRRLTAVPTGRDVGDGVNELQTRSSNASTRDPLHVRSVSVSAPPAREIGVGATNWASLGSLWLVKSCFLSLHAGSLSAKFALDARQRRPAGYG